MAVDGASFSRSACSNTPMLRTRAVNRSRQESDHVRSILIWAYLYAAPRTEVCPMSIARSRADLVSCRLVTRISGQPGCLRALSPHEKHVLPAGSRARDRPPEGARHAAVTVQEGDVTCKSARSAVQQRAASAASPDVVHPPADVSAGRAWGQLGGLRSEVAEKGGAVAQAAVDHTRSRLRLVE